MESLFNGITLANVLLVHSQIQSASHKPVSESLLMLKDKNPQKHRSVKPENGKENYAAIWNLHFVATHRPKIKNKVKSYLSL